VKGGQNSRTTHAVISYSWISPPRTSLKGASTPIRGMTSGFHPGSFGRGRESEEEEHHPGYGPWARYGPEKVEELGVYAEVGPLTDFWESSPTRVRFDADLGGDNASAH
jgi:hypothetical protein